MSTEHTNVALTVQTGSPVTKLALLYLAHLADDDGVCSPSVADLATAMGMSERRALAALRELLAKGFIRGFITGSDPTEGYKLTLTTEDQ